MREGGRGGSLQVTTVQHEKPTKRRKTVTRVIITSTFTIMEGPGPGQEKEDQWGDTPSVVVVVVVVVVTYRGLLLSLGSRWEVYLPLTRLRFMRPVAS